MRSLPDELLGGPFATATARAAGLRPGVLRGPAVERLFVGAYRPAQEELTFELLVEAALLVAPPDALVTGVTALRRYGATVGPPQPLHLVSTHPHPVRRPGLKVTRSVTLPPARGRLVRGEHAFLASAATLDLVELVTAGDHLVRRGHVMTETLLAACDGYRGRGALRARRAAGLVRAGVDSPRESELRLCLVLAGLPEPACNPLIGGPRLPVGRADLVYLQLKVVIEYEGDQHRTDIRQWNRDIERQELLNAEGWIVVRITADRMSRPRSVVVRVLQALREAGYTGPDPVLTPEWLSLFGSTVRSQRLARSFQSL